MQLLHFEITKSTDLNTFISFWSRLYTFYNDFIYSLSTSKDKFEVEDLQNLFEWKNGMRLSDLKQKTIIMSNS